MNSLRFQIIEPAERELQDIFDYYEAETERLGPPVYCGIPSGGAENPAVSFCLATSPGKCSKMYLEKVSISRYLCGNQRADHHFGDCPSSPKTGLLD